MIAEAVYLLCALTSIACAAMLVRGYLASRSKLLLWSSLCFVGLALNNTLLFLDLVVVPTVDLSAWRTGSALVSITILVFGLVWDAR